MAKISEALLLFLVNAVWQVALVTLLAAAAGRMLRRARASYRHLLWVVALVAALALPIVTTLRTVPVPAPPAPVPNIHISKTPAVEISSVRPPADEPLPSMNSTRWSVPSLSFSSRIALAISGVYALLLLFRIGSLAAAWMRTRRIVHQAADVVLPRTISQAFERCRAALGTGEVRVLSSSVPVPVTAGALRPVVILPESLLREADPEIATSAIGHELAHIARHDYLFNLAYEFLALPLWFHPALALVLRRISETREVRCDEIVTERLQDARVYAQSLVELAGAALPFGRAAATITVGIADADILEERVKTLLNRPRLKKQALLLIAAATLFAVPCIAAARMALRVNIQPAAATVLPAPQEQTNPRQEFINQHQPGDMVRGKVVKTTQTRAVIELAPGVSSVIRIPETSSTPYVVGSEHDFQLLRTSPEQTGFALFDPSSAAPGGPSGGVQGGVEGGVRAKVLGGVEGGKEGPFMVRSGDALMTVSPKIGYALLDQEQKVGYALFDQEQSSDPLIRRRMEAAQAKRAMEEKERFARDEAQLTPEEKAKRIELIRAKMAAERKQLLETAREAKITMEQAISIAQTKQPGTVFESRLLRERGVATYVVGIVSGDENNVIRTRFLINAADGTVMDTFKSENE